MRPHRLRVTAFGAFAATEQVIFDDLEGLFLLHGETGAGKTTLLDAIAFALYGRVPGERASARRLRSDHASPATSTEVELEATIGGRRLRITRKPEQSRPKKSGTGVTTEPASVRLAEFSADGTWESKSTRIGEVDAEIENLMGMSAAQFFQVVLLPQGEFAKFLRADAKDKESLLQKLFGTDRFRKVEDWLADRRRATDKEVAAADETVGRLIAQISQAAGSPLPGEVPDPSEWMASLAAQALADQAGAADRVAARRGDLDAALAAQGEARTMADRQRRRRDALRWQRELQAAAPEIDRLRAEAEAAIRAAEVAPVLDASDRAAAAAGSARAAEEAARAVLPDNTDNTALPGNTVPRDNTTVPANGAGTPRDAARDALAAASQQQQAQVVRLETLRLLARDADAEDETATASRSQAAEVADELGRAEAAAAQRATARPPAQAARDAARQAAQALPAAQAQAEIARRVATHRAALVGAHARRAELHEAHLAARETAVAAQAAALGVRERRIDGMRAELAAEMTQGSPCPVCGSLDHPDPVDAASFPPVSRGEEEAAFGLASGAAAAAEEAGQQVAAVDAVIHDLAERLAADSARPAASAPAALSAAAGEAESDADRHEAAAAELSAAAGHLDDLQLKLDALDAAIADDKSTMTELTEQRAAALAAAQAAAQRATDRRRELRDQLGDAPDLETALDCASRLAAAFATAADAAAETTRAEAEAGVAYQRGVQTAVDAGFARSTSAAAPDETPAAAPDEGAIAMARAAFRDARWRADIAAAVSKHEADARTVETQVADPDLDVGLDVPAPVEETTEAAKAAQQAHDEANTAYGTTQHRTQQLALLRPQLDAAINALQPLRERTDQIRHLADLANGTSGANQYKMTLSSFVLAARLEEVAAAASERLLTMTAGRYSLVHSDARRGNAKAGLSLLACDAWTGIDRDTATLSGGETFLASLALALGLADVVTAESAGTPMEALFVDEGFGTLDEDTLDEVMNVLDSLRAGGRLVGIVSHVTELRQRIPAQVHVRKSRTGSRVEITPG